MKLYIIFILSLITTLIITINAVHAETFSTYPIDDAFVDEQSYNAHFPIDSLRVGKYDDHNQRIYLRFHLPEIENIKIKSANISMFQYLYIGNEPREYAIHTVYQKYWDEYYLTWMTESCGPNFDNSYFCNLTQTNITKVHSADDIFIWGVTPPIKEWYANKRDKISFAIKLINESQHTGYNFSRFFSSEDPEVFRPTLTIEYQNIIGINTLYHENDTFINTNDVTLGCYVTGNVPLHSVSLYLKINDKWRRISTNTSGQTNTTYDFTIPIKQGGYEWACTSRDINRDIQWSDIKKINIDTSNNIPQELACGADSINPYDNITLYSKWWGHSDEIIEGIVEEDSSGEMTEHFVIAEDGWINFTIGNENLSRNKIITYRFKARNSIGWNETDWLYLTVDDYWEPEDKYFQSFKRNIDYVKNNLYTKYVGPYGLPITHDTNENYTMVRTVQSSGIIGLTLLYTRTNDKNYLDIANDIADWIIQDQTNGYYGYYKYFGGYDKPDNIYTSTATAERMFTLAEITGNITQQKSAENALNYHTVLFA
ncbi:DNRLRE domain-containing protein [Candidatus Aenigmatarchaeota archaeon]